MFFIKITLITFLKVNLRFCEFFFSLAENNKLQKIGKNIQYSIILFYLISMILFIRAKNAASGYAELNRVTYPN